MTGSRWWERDRSGMMFSQPGLNGAHREDFDGGWGSWVFYSVFLFQNFASIFHEALKEVLTLYDPLSGAYSVTFTN
ncbi:hypothetical protein P8452_49584 [Trifolium repens]|nr:hypothetical protein P8452_49584 [Trifolium repens]